MVRRLNPLQQRDFFPPTREANWHPEERSFLDSPQDTRFGPAHNSPIHPRSLTIEAALRDCVGLPVKEFALIVALESGEEKTYTSQYLTPCQPRIFSERFRADFRRATADGDYSASVYQDETSPFEVDVDDSCRQASGGESSSSRRHHRQSRPKESSGSDSANGKRKRARGALYTERYNNVEDTPVPVPVMKTQQLRIGDTAEVEKFYAVRFKDMQQSSCKVMGKAFVKLVEPKKQTHHPYTKGDAQAPPWWPKSTGELHVRHREPDHLLRPERIRLLVHILKMVIEPHDRQCPTVQKLGLNVKKLQDVTMEAMSTWFNDVEHPENLSKKPYLKEIFKVARAQERFKNDEIDADTCIPVMYGDRSNIDYSDDEAEEGVKDEDEESESTLVNTQLPTPESITSQSQPMMQNQHSQQYSEQDTSNMFMGATRPLPLRYQTQPQMDDHQPYPNSSYLSRPVGVGFQTASPPPQDPNRRSFGSPVYPSPQSMYGWQNTNMASSGTMNSNYFTPAGPQAPLGSHSQAGQFQLPPPPPPLTQQPMLPPMAQHHFDAGPTARQFDSGPALGNQLRTGSLGHPHQIPHAFQEYLHENGGYGHNVSDVREEQQ